MVHLATALRMVSLSDAHSYRVTLCWTRL